MPTMGKLKKLCKKVFLPKKSASKNDEVSHDHPPVNEMTNWLSAPSTLIDPTSLDSHDAC